MPSRVLWVGLAFGVIGIAILWIWGIRNAGLLPDVGDPFDVAAILKPIVIPDSDNAFVLYAQAKDKLPKRSPGFANVDFATVTWFRAGEELRLFVDGIGQALEIWREGTDRPNALYHQSAEIAWDTPLPLVGDLATLVRMAGLEGSRHEEKGEMAEAWTWYRAMLRSSRHVGMNGVLVERMIGAMHLRLASRRIVHWAADPRVDAKLLRQALADALAADTMTPPLSLALKLDYAVEQRDLVELKGILREISMPGGRYGWLEQMANSTGAKPQIQRFRLRATNDVERSSPRHPPGLRQLAATGRQASYQSGRPSRSKSRWCSSPPTRAPPGGAPSRRRTGRGHRSHSDRAHDLRARPEECQDGSRCRTYSGRRMGSLRSKRNGGAS